MDEQLKKRVIGAAVLVVVVVVALPWLISWQGDPAATAPMESNIPDKPDREFQTIEIPLEVPPKAEERERRRVVEQPQRVARRAEEGATEPPAEEPAQEPEAVPQPEETPEETAAEAREAPAQTAKAPEPQPEAPPPAAPAEPNAWVVQVGSFGNADNAFGLRDKLRKAGFTTFVEEVTADGKTVYRVRVGPEQEEALAEQVRERLQSRLDLKGLVMSYP